MSMLIRYKVILLIHFFLSLQPCERYQFVVSDSEQDGWQEGFWSLVYANNTQKRGWRTFFGSTPGINDLLYQIDWGDGESFSDTDTTYWSMPCMPECPESQTLETNNNCEVVNFIPDGIDPIICPNTCIEPTIIRAQIDKGSNFSIDTTLIFPVTTGTNLDVGQHRVIYEVIYEDGQIVRCTSEINVVVEINPTIACNNNVQITLGEFGSCDVTITPDLLLEDFIDCSNEYIVTIFNEEGNSIGNAITPDEAGQTLNYTVSHIHSDNFCWGILTVEDKSPPVINCINDQLACNNPAAFDTDHNFQFTNTYQGHSSELPANIAGGSIQNPSITTLQLFSDMSCATTGEVVAVVRLDLRIRHSDIEDLTATITAPNGMEILLLDRPCLGTDNMDLDVTFRDDGSDAICQANTNFSISGNIRPSEDNGEDYRGFSRFNNLSLETLNGVWLLKIYDSDNGTGNGDNEVGQGEIQIADLQITSTFRTDAQVADCSKDPILSLLNQEVIPALCNPSTGSGALIVRIWQAEDAFGNIATCEQVVELIQPTLQDLDLPQDITFECTPDTGTGSVIGGLPHFDCMEITPEEHSYCNISYTYEDETLELCGNTFEIIRTWIILNWCTGAILYHQQMIHTEDNRSACYHFCRPPITYRYL